MNARADDKPAAPQPRSLASNINKICDRFEAAWNKKQHPRIESYLENTVEPEHAVLLGELLTLELELRLKSGEQPTLADYKARFPRVRPGRSLLSRGMEGYQHAEFDSRRRRKF
jgi:hypothetical protein